MRYRALAHVLAIYQDRGLKTFTVQVIKKLLAPKLQMGSICFFERDLRAPMPPVAPLEGIVLREGSLSDISLLDCLKDAGRQKKHAVERLRAGHHWYVSIEKETGRLMTYRWASMTNAFIPEINRTIVLKPGEAYLYDLYTLPEFRRRRIQPAAHLRFALPAVRRITPRRLHPTRQLRESTGRKKVSDPARTRLVPAVLRWRNAAVHAEESTHAGIANRKLER